MPRSRFLSVALCAAIMAGAAPAWAQDRPERPYRGLFRSGLSNDSQQTLVFNGSLGGGFDDNVVADAFFGERVRTSNLNTSVSGFVGQAAGSLSYGLNLGTATVAASGGTTVHYYPSLDTNFLRRYHVSVGTDVQLTRWVSAHGLFSYRPFSLSSMFPLADFGSGAGLPPVGGDLEGTSAGATIPDIDFASSLEHYRTYGGGVDYTRPLSRRLEVTLDYTFSRRDASLVTRAFSSHRGGGGFTYQANRDLALRVQYRHAMAVHPTADRMVRHHLIDAGVDYSRSLSFSRRTSVSFSTGTAAVTRPELSNFRTTFRLIGDARLTHEIGRTWNAAVAYARTARFDEDWPDLVSTDSVTASLGGMVSRRVQFSANARTSTGSIGLSQQNNRFNGHYGHAGLSYAVSRNVNAGLTYAYYRHRFDEDVALPADFANRFSRHSVKASISFWAPLFESRRRSNASR